LHPEKETQQPVIDNLRISKEVIFQELEGEAVLLNMQSGIFFGLNPVAKRMWELLNELGQAEKVLQQLLREYEASEEQLRQDLVNFIERLKSKGLVEIQ
jgi:Coenzyme PQQ synthesis protein D (PqqD)